MTYALIDNATLTAVQRVSGEIVTKSRDSVDTDIVALENLVQSILFYDRVIALDDYIPRFRKSRQSAFPFITFLGRTEFDLDDISQLAENRASKIRPEIRGGEFANDDFKSLFELLKTHVICTWDISSSVYFLTLKCLADDGSADFDKYGNLVASIFAELGEASKTGERPSADVALVDRFGKTITKGYTVPGAHWGKGESGGTTPAVRAFVAALVWLANRSIFYTLAAKYFQADTFLHPVRQAYQQYYLSESCNYGMDYTRRIVEHASSTLSKDLIDMQHGGLSTATSMDLPVFSGWLAKETGDPSKIVDAALELKSEPEFVEVREKFRLIRKAFDENDIAAANRIVAGIVEEIAKASRHLRARYGLQTAQGVPVTRLVQVYNTIAAIKGLPTLPDHDLEIPLPKFIRDLKKPSGFNAIYRNLSHELSAVWSLGEARDILGAKIVKDENAVVYSPKNELPRFRNSHSPFKSPM